VTKILLLLLSLLLFVITFMQVNP